VQYGFDSLRFCVFEKFHAVDTSAGQLSNGDIAYLL
jgi:hypothetical protein